MSLPILELKYNKTSDKQISNNNTNTLHNNIVLGTGLTANLAEIPEESSTLIQRSESPNNIKQFKEALISILISYFKNNVVLLNNLVELSDKIITKVDDLRLLISLLIEHSPAAVNIEVEEIEIKNCCGTICKNLPQYRKIKHIIINNKQTFQVSYNQFYIQMGTEVNISLEYILL
jgi:Ser-tRNA(Ala) deacylase AlaX